MTDLIVGGLDSSFNRPTRAQARAARAAGIRAWGGYFGSSPGLGLATLWSRADFAVLQAEGIQPIGFCSGWDDEDWIRNTAAEWGIQPCVDVERGIRDDGPWVAGWVRRAQAGLYGAMSVHYETGEPPGRGANFNILAWYPGYDPRSSWFDAIELRPPGPCGWQWQGTHSEFGLSVDRLWFDGLIITSGPGRGGDTGELLMNGMLQAAPFKPDRLDLIVVGADGVVRRRWADGGAGELEGYKDADYFAIDADNVPAGGFAGVEWCWSQGPTGWRQNITAFDQDGHIWLAVIDWLGNQVQGWTRLPITILAPPSGGEPGPAGPAGPPGEAVDDDHIAEIAAAEIERRLANG